MSRPHTQQRGILATHSLALLRSRGRPSHLHKARRKFSALPASPTERGGPPPLLGLSPGLCGPGRTVACLMYRTVNDPVVAVPEGIAAFFLTFQRLALEGIRGEPVNETDEPGYDVWVGAAQFLEVSIRSRISLDPEASRVHASGCATEWSCPSESWPAPEQFPGPASA